LIEVHIEVARKSVQIEKKVDVDVEVAREGFKLEGSRLVMF
jgi:hypothetical protein